MTLEEAIRLHAAAIEKLADALIRNAAPKEKEEPKVRKPRDEKPIPPIVAANESTVSGKVGHFQGGTTDAAGNVISGSPPPATNGHVPTTSPDSAALRTQAQALVLAVVAKDKGREIVLKAFETTHPGAAKLSAIPDDKLPAIIAALGAV